MPEEVGVSTQFRDSVLKQIDRSHPRFSGYLHPDEITERAAMEARDRVMSEIDRLRLREFVGQLDSDGFTIIPPERAAPPGFAEKLRGALLTASLSGPGNEATIKPDVINTDTSPFGQVRFTTGLLREGIIFEQMLMNEIALALLSYLLGESCILHEMVGFVKGPGIEFLPLHTDQNQNSTPAPFPAIAQIANVTWALTDYDEGNGSTCFVAGSHKFCRHPSAREATDLSLFQPVEARAGSMLVWHGNTWHGAVPRTNPGLRVSCVMQFARWYHRVRESFAEMLTPEAFRRNSPRLAVLTRKDYGVGGTESRRVASVSQFA
jgi:hypothetical protein